MGLGPFVTYSPPTSYGPGPSLSRDLVASWDDVPLRPGASVRLWYVAEDGCVLLTVTDGPSCVPVARYSGGSIEYPCGKTGWRPAGDADGPWHVRALGNDGAVAVGVLRASGTFCGSQAASDYSDTRGDPLWAELVWSMSEYLHAAAVLFS